jgi:hypothetical protein
MKGQFRLSERIKVSHDRKPHPSCRPDKYILNTGILRHHRRIPVVIPFLKPEAPSGKPLKVLPPVVGFERMTIILLT